MAVDLAQIVGAENMSAASLDAVLAKLRELQTDTWTKRYLLARWGQVVNLNVDEALKEFRA